MKTSPKTLRKEARRRKIKARVRGTAETPRLALYRSNTRVFVQLIDDVAGKTLASVSSDKEKGATQKERALTAAKTIAGKAKALGVTKVVFDRGGNRYVGTVKEFADTAREAGLQF
jgi:large subunit ribosomal protein L18